MINVYFGYIWYAEMLKVCSEGHRHKTHCKKYINLTEFLSDLFVFFVDNRFLGVGYITNKQTSKLKSMEIKEWIDVRLITFKKDLKRLLVILTICQI